MNPPPELVKLTHGINKASFRVNRRRDTCILTSNALHFVFGLLERQSRLVRVTLAVFPKDRKHYAASLGSMGDGTRRPKAGHRMWNGHLAVLVEEKWLCDATADQANQEGIEVPPLVVEMESLDPWKATHFKVNNCDARYNLYHRQAGFRWAGDARPSHWMPVVKALAITVCTPRFQS